MLDILDTILLLTIAFSSAFCGYSLRAYGEAKRKEMKSK